MPNYPSIEDAGLAYDPSQAMADVCAIGTLTLHHASLVARKMPAQEEQTRSVHVSLHHGRTLGLLFAYSRTALHTQNAIQTT